MRHSIARSPWAAAAFVTALVALVASDAAHAQENNLARLGTARQSSTLVGGVAARAIDGNTDGAWGNSSVTHTDGLAGSWLEVDLGAPKVIGSIFVWNRTDCCGERLNGVKVQLSSVKCDAATPAVIAERTLQPSGAAVPAMTRLELVDAPSARYVCLRNSGSLHLSVAELQAYAPPTTPAPLLACDSTIELTSWKGDSLHRPDSAQGVTTSSASPRNAWKVQCDKDTVWLRSWKNDWLHRPDSAQGVTTFNQGGPGNR